MSVETPGIFIQSGGETAERARRALHALTGIRGGIVQAGDLAVTENGTPNMSVNVATGQVAIPGTEGTFQGVYILENRGALNVAIAAADATNPRKDLIVAKVQDAAYSGGSNVFSIVAVTGTPAASPAEPAIPANAWVLAMVDVPALDTAITNSQITDRRTSQTGQKGRAAALGGHVICTQANRPPHVEGLFIYETDTDRTYVSTGAAWRYVAGPDATTAQVTTEETSTSTSYTDLTTAGPAVSVYMEPGQKVLILLDNASFIDTSPAGARARMSFAVSGSETIAASDSDAVTNSIPADYESGAKATLFTATGSAGTRTFTCKYKVTGAVTGTWNLRRITAIPQF